MQRAADHRARAATRGALRGARPAAARSTGRAHPRHPDRRAVGAPRQPRLGDPVPLPRLRRPRRRGVGGGSCPAGGGPAGGPAGGGLGARVERPGRPVRALPRGAHGRLRPVAWRSPPAGRGGGGDRLPGVGHAGTGTLGDRAVGRACGAGRGPGRAGPGRRGQRPGGTGWAFGGRPCGAVGRRAGGRLCAGAAGAGRGGVRARRRAGHDPEAGHDRPTTVTSGAMLLVVAWSDAYRLPLEVLTPAGRKAVDRVRSTCLEELAKDPEQVAVRLSDLLTTPPWPALLARNTPGHAATPAPILLTQGADDDRVTPGATRALVQRLCRLGDTVELRTWRDTGHFDIPRVAADDVVAWIGERLAGRPARTTCQP